jgi:hypothetical protein
VCDWIVSVTLRGTVVVRESWKNKQKRKWKTQHKTTKITTKTRENNI